VRAMAVDGQGRWMDLQADQPFVNARGSPETLPAPRPGNPRGMSIFAATGYTSRIGGRRNWSSVARDQ
jgi:hypothetical protein